jgi:phosphopantothenoylcysteine decarboxylase/phosphopantothenate--cysteine ligase
MSVLKDKKILLGVSGGIAAYKTAHLVRLFIKAGAQVQVIMSPASLDFVTPLTLSTLSKNPVYFDFIDEQSGKLSWNNHVELGLWPDFMIFAPATANTLSKMAQGLCDNLLMATYLSAKCPIFIAPAMDLDMYKHPSTIQNINALKAFNHEIIPAESGELASGLSGEGRMAEPENIVNFIEKSLSRQLPLLNKKILITAGPTYEAIDPVRFIGNHASGKMGYALAEQAAQLGAEVILVSGPSHLEAEHPWIKTVRVTSAQDMFDSCMSYFDEVDVVIAAAAVADYKPKEVAKQKIKKKEDIFDISLEKTKDILGYLGQNKKHQILIGFALETENEIENAKQKIIKKNLDYIVLNSLNDQGAGFGQPTNKITLIDKNLIIKTFDLKPKDQVAKDILAVLL